MPNVVELKHWKTTRRDLEDDVAGAAEEILKGISKQGDKLDEMHRTLIRAVTKQEANTEKIQKLEECGGDHTKKIQSLDKWRAGLAAVIAAVVVCVGWMVKIFPWTKG